MNLFREFLDRLNEYPVLRAALIVIALAALLAIATSGLTWLSDLMVPL